MIVQAFVSHLKDDAPLMALVNGIWPHFIPAGQDAPAVTYAVDSELFDQQLQGLGTYRRIVFDVNCFAESYEDALAIQAAVEAALVDYRGVLGNTSPEIFADHIRIENRFPDDYELDTRLRRVAAQYLIGYT